MIVVLVVCWVLLRICFVLVWVLVSILFDLVLVVFVSWLVVFWVRFSICVVFRVCFLFIFVEIVVGVGLFGLGLYVGIVWVVCGVMLVLLFVVSF